MKHFTILTIIVFTLVSTFENDQNFDNSINRSYDDNSKDAQRYRNFQKNDEEINEHNEKFKRGESLYTMGHNQFSDMSDEEIKQIFPELKQPFDNIQFKSFKLPKTFTNFPPGPSYISYQNYCLPALNQRKCGSCWAFAAAAQVEAQLKRKDFSLFNTYISPQYLVDCSQTNGCNGGWPFKALNHLYKHGLVTLTNYNYDAVRKSCKNNMPRMTKKIKSPPVNLGIRGNEIKLKNILASVGPVTLAIWADVKRLTKYQSGIFSEPTCQNSCKRFNHIVLLVGYGTDNTSGSSVDYWLIKNSWGSNWGENGYFRLIRNGNKLKNNCKVACYMAYAVV